MLDELDNDMSLESWLDTEDECEWDYWGDTKILGTASVFNPNMANYNGSLNLNDQLFSDDCSSSSVLARIFLSGSRSMSNSRTSEPTLNEAIANVPYTNDLMEDKKTILSWKNKPAQEWDSLEVSHWALYVLSKHVHVFTDLAPKLCTDTGKTLSEMSRNDFIEKMADVKYGNILYEAFKDVASNKCLGSDIPDEEVILTLQNAKLNSNTDSDEYGMEYVNDCDNMEKVNLSDSGVESSDELVQSDGEYTSSSYENMDNEAESEAHNEQVNNRQPRILELYDSVFASSLGGIKGIINGRNFPPEAIECKVGILGSLSDEKPVKKRPGRPPGSKKPPKDGKSNSNSWRYLTEQTLFGKNDKRDIIKDIHNSMSNIEDTVNFLEGFASENNFDSSIIEDIKNNISKLKVSSPSFDRVSNMDEVENSFVNIRIRDDGGRYLANGNENDNFSDEETNDQNIIKKRRPGRPRGRVDQVREKKIGKLWENIKQMLYDPKCNPSMICWDDFEKGVFRFTDSSKAAKYWGKIKGNNEMTFEKMTRAMRYHYKNKVLKPVDKKLFYQFGEKAAGWRRDDLYVIWLNESKKLAAIPEF